MGVSPSASVTQLEILQTEAPGAKVGREGDCGTQGIVTQSQSDTVSMSETLKEVNQEIICFVLVDNLLH